MMPRPKLLFLCQTLPFPADCGVHIRSYNVFRLLTRDYDVTALCFYRRATRPSKEQVQAGVEGLGRHANAYAFPIPQEEKRSRLLWDHLRSSIMRRPYTYFTYDSRHFRRTLKDLLARENFSVVHLDSLDLSRHLDLLGSTPVVCTHHNVESDLLLRRAATESSPFLRPYLRYQSLLMRAEERRLAPVMATNAMVSSADAARLRNIAPSASTTVVPNGVDTTYFRPLDVPDERGIVFVGGHSWYPNRDGMAYFAAEILPEIRRDEMIPCTWVGRASDEVVAAYQKHQIHLTGYVDDVRQHIAEAACYVVPLRVGGGTRLKVLDAWAMGKAVVSTSLGCEGLEAKDGYNILIRDDPKAFAQAVRDVVADPELRATLKANARRTAVEIYDWERIGENMLATYGRIVAPIVPGASRELAARE